MIARAALLIAAAFAATPALAEANRDAILAQRPAKLLSEYGFFDDLTQGTPAVGVVPYSVNAALFTDYAEKDRYVFTPAPAAWQSETVLDFPVGAALIKTFRYGAHKVETRVLLHQDAGWKAYPYLWNAEGTEAVLTLAGADVALTTEHGAINYHVPNANQCKGCHIGPDKTFTPIGPKLRNLNGGDQLARLVAAGVLVAGDNAPMMPDYLDPSQPLDLRARAYLDVNCGHCHAAGLPADTTALYLNWDETRPEHLGVLKRPVAAGRGSGDLQFDIVPGAPDASILLYRLAGTDPGFMMPEIGRSLAHEEGVQLIRDWIAAMEP